MGQARYFRQRWAIDKAKVLMLSTFNDPRMNQKIKAAAIIKVLNQQGVLKAEIKIARKELGVISTTKGGITFWELPGDLKNA